MDISWCYFIFLQTLCTAVSIQLSLVSYKVIVWNEILEISKFPFPTDSSETKMGKKDLYRKEILEKSTCNIDTTCSFVY